MTGQASAGMDSRWIATAPLAEVRQALLGLFAEVAYKEGNFVLSSGQSSPYYINGKLVTLHPWGGLAVGRVLLAEVEAGAIAVAGLTLGADPLVTAASVVAAYEGRSLTALIIRKEAKGHGTQAYIEGPVLPETSTITVLEDVVTTGGSALKAVTRLQDAGYQVNQIISLVDRKQGGAELYAQHGLGFKTIFTIDEIQQAWKARQPSDA